MRGVVLTVCLGMVLAGSAARAQSVFLWWEAEAAVEHNFPAESPYGPDTLNKTLLSGETWLSAPNARFGPPLFAKYEVSVPRAGTFSFWVRKFWYHGPFRWRFDDQPWRECGRQIGLADSVYLRKFVCANWVFLGEVTLSQGKHLLQLETTDAVLNKPPDKPLPPVDPERVTTSPADWCTVTLPKTLSVGQTVPVKVQYKGISPKTKLCCESHWNGKNGKWAGFMSWCGPFPEVEGDGEHTFDLLVKDKGTTLGSVTCLIYLSPEGTYGTRTKEAKVAAIPVDPASIPTVLGASAVGMDCFVLTDGLFVPRGKLRPNEKYNRTEEGWFPFEPDLLDPYDPSALLDLRAMNHKQCGEKGYLRAAGMDFVFERDPTPVKFWGVCVGDTTVWQDKATVNSFARRLAKRGVNMVRLHGKFHGGVPGDPLGISDDYMDHFNYFVSALRREGIYLMLNTYYDLFFTVTPDMNIPGYKEGDHTPHFLFIHPRGQEIWRGWVKRLLSNRNPYTGMVNAEDPTIAIVQIVNEDNYFWSTFQPYTIIPEPVIQVLEKRFGDWLTRKYGSLEKALEAWGKDSPKVRGDVFEESRVGLNASWTMGPRTRAPKRLDDQAQFLTEDLRDVLSNMQDYLKNDLGFRGLVNGGNWMSAELKVLEPLDKYANAVCDVMDRHGCGFYAPAQLARSWELAVGDRYRDVSALSNPMRVSLMDTQYADKPHVISEPKSAMPNRYRAEWLPLMAAYGLLQGTDALTHFSGEHTWSATNDRWPVDTPVMLGQSPATALIFRNRYLREGPVVVHEGLRLADLYQGKSTVGVTSARIGETPDGNPPQDDVTQAEVFKRLAFYVGMVKRTVSDDPPPSTTMDIAPYVSAAESTVRSATGEIAWNWGKGLLTLSAPCAQGAVGFLKDAGPIELPDVAINSLNDYAGILIVSMDGKPLKTSDRILLQVMTEDKNYGWQTKKVQLEDKKQGKVEWEEITSVGEAPILVRNIEGTVAIRRPDVGRLQLTALDLNGYKRQDLPLQVAADGATLKLLPDCLYYILTLRP